jgi:hypothetical protein
MHAITHSPAAISVQRAELSEAMKRNHAMTKYEYDFVYADKDISAGVATDLMNALSEKGYRLVNSVQYPSATAQSRAVLFIFERELPWLPEASITEFPTPALRNLFDALANEAARRGIDL